MRKFIVLDFEKYPRINGVIERRLLVFITNNGVDNYFLLIAYIKKGDYEKEYDDVVIRGFLA